MDGVHSMPGVYCFWHQCIIAASYRYRGQNIAIMISRSADGEYIARISQKLGFRPVRGSSSRGGVGALIGLRQEIELGHAAVFTIDGPRGPIYVAKPGPVMLAKKTGYPIVCFHLAVERAWILNSWDKMRIPKPFSRVTVYLSKALVVPPDASEESLDILHQEMQAMLDRCRERAEAQFPMS
ncbi:MAG TPA: lysophospholipid acyltransferase family protein [Candidatus Angelobacter sp.]|nr:lysophospholipid acyltransferase family protein [Candidatus Angelobacter sp.]